MTPAEETVRRFYECLVRDDGDGAGACYRDDATFRDIAFEQEGRDDIAAMWRFECKPPGLKATFRDIRTEGDEVKGHWACDYDYDGDPAHHVHNEIDSTFTLRDGKILRHVDEASRWRWARQALGLFGAIGVTVFPCVLRWKAKRKLEAFLARERSGGH